MKKRTILTTILAAALMGGPGVATAQDFDDDFEEDFDDDFEEEPAEDDFGDDFDEPADDGGDDMAMASEGSAGERGLGVGAIAPLANVGGLGAIFGAAPSVSYDMGDFHIDGLLLFSTNDAQTDFGLGARFFYHLVQHARSDLSAGGGVTFLNQSPEAGDSSNLIFLEAGVKIRMFLVEQVAISSTAGLILGVGDADGVSLGGQVIGGVTYYFD